MSAPTVADSANLPHRRIIDFAPALIGSRMFPSAASSRSEQIYFLGRVERARSCRSMALGSTPAIACIGVIGQYDNPLHISLFPPHENELLDMSFLLNSSLDIFDIRQRSKTLDQDLGLLHAIDERLAAYGWLTNTGIKFIVVVDMMGRPPGAEAELRASARNVPPVIGLRDADLKPAFRAIQTAYINLLMNPFYTPEERSPLQLANSTGKSAEIKSQRFIAEIQRIGKTWYPGIPNT